MGLADYKDLLGTSASICTIIQLLVPVWMCRKYITDGTTGEASSLPFVVGCLSSSLWLKYGLLLGETSLIVVNSIAVILQIGYVVVFYRYCSKKNQIILQMVGVSAILILTLLYTAFEADERIVVYRVGMLCCLMTVMFFAAPLSQLAYVIRVRSAESLPFLLIVMTFITSAQWLLYGYIIKDPFVQIPNVLGLLLSSFQLSLFVIFPARRRSQENARPLFQDVGIAQ